MKACEFICLKNLYKKLLSDAGSSEIIFLINKSSNVGTVFGCLYCMSKFGTVNKSNALYFVYEVGCQGGVRVERVFKSGVKCLAVVSATRSTSERLEPLYFTSARHINY